MLGLILHRPVRGRSYTPSVSTIRGNRRPHRGLVPLLVAVTVVAVAAVCAVRTYRVHEAGWEWRLTSSAAPPKVHFAGRDYERGSLDGAHPPLSYVRQGTTPGGGVIYAPPGPYTHVVITVRDGRRSFEYALMGGP